MQQPNASSGLLGWAGGIFSDVLTRQKIIDALNDELNKSDIEQQTKDFISFIIIPYLKTTQDEPLQMAKALKGVINATYLECAPDAYYWRSPAYRDAQNKPEIPSYANVKIVNDNWKACFKAWQSRAEPEGAEDSPAKKAYYSAFAECLLAAIPEDGTIYFTNVNTFTKLQALARKYNIQNSVANSHQSIELKERPKMSA